MRLLNNLRGSAAMTSVYLAIHVVSTFDSKVSPATWAVSANCTTTPCPRLSTSTTVTDAFPQCPSTTPSPSCARLLPTSIRTRAPIQPPCDVTSTSAASSPATVPTILAFHQSVARLENTGTVSASAALRPCPVVPSSAPMYFVASATAANEPIATHPLSQRRFFHQHHTRMCFQNRFRSLSASQRPPIATAGTHTSLARRRSLLYARVNPTPLSAFATIRACASPCAFSTVSSCPWITPSLFACVSPCRTRYTRATSAFSGIVFLCFALRMPLVWVFKPSKSDGDNPARGAERGDAGLCGRAVS